MNPSRTFLNGRGPSFPFNTTALLCLLTSGLTCSKGEFNFTSQELKYLTLGQFNKDMAGGSVPISQYNSNTSLPAQLGKTGGRFKPAVSICAQGMWALYNRTNFGEGFEDPSSTVVISLKAYNMSSCSKPDSIPMLKTVQSVRFLGNADPSQDTLVIYSMPYFLGGSWSLPGPASNPPTGITGFNLGSLAITGFKNAWRICGDMDCVNAVCVDMSGQKGGLFMVRNSVSESKGSEESGTQWPLVVRRVDVVSSEECLQDLNPISRRALSLLPSPDQEEERPVLGTSNSKADFDDLQVHIWDPQASHINAGIIKKD